MSIDTEDERLTKEEAASATWGQRGTVGPVFAGRVDIRDICFEISSKQLLSKINFVLEAGEIGCLLGASGCGKSTLLRVISGLEMQTSGSIFMDHVELSGPKVFVPPEKRSIGLMFQDYALFPHLTVLQNVMFGLHELKRRDARLIAQQALERVGLLDLSNSYPTRLSGGEQQRVALARAIVPRPQVMLMDEPFSGLDQRLRQQIRTETVALLREMRATALVVTHDPMEALEISDKIILMRSGEIVQSGEPYELFDRPTDIYAARFLSPADEITGRVINGLVATPLGPVPAKGVADGKPVTVLLRPEAVMASSDPRAVQGRIISTTRQGRGLLCKFVTDEASSAISVRIEGLRSASIGDIRRFELRLDQVLVFETETGIPI